MWAVRTTVELRMYCSYQTNFGYEEKTENHGGGQHLSCRENGGGRVEINETDPEPKQRDDEKETCDVDDGRNLFGIV